MDTVDYIMSLRFAPGAGDLGVIAYQTGDGVEVYVANLEGKGAEHVWQEPYTLDLGEHEREALRGRVLASAQAMVERAQLAS